MQKSRLALSMLLLLPLAPAYAADADVRVIVSGEIRPGVYGRVEFGRASPPPVVYAEPRIVVRTPQPVQVQPIYLHVPPGHAKDWSKHCGKYNACGSSVYFVKSAEYEPKKAKKEKKEKN